MGKYPIRKDLHRMSYYKVPVFKVLIPLMNFCLSVMKKEIRSDERVRVRKVIIPGDQGRDLLLRIFEPNNCKEPSSCLFYCHGGGFFLKACAFHYRNAKLYAIHTPCKVIFVEYHLAPKYSYPIPVKDCFVAYQWVLQHAQRLRIQPKKIAIGGDSAGGNIAATLAIMIRDHKLVMPCFQLLIYPVIDYRMKTKSMRRFLDTPITNHKVIHKMWSYYLNGKVPQGRDKRYLSLMEQKDYSKLPAAYVETAEFDCLHDEAIAYAKRLVSAGCKVEINETKGTVHGFDCIEKSQLVHHCLKRRIHVLKASFSEKKS